MEKMDSDRKCQHLKVFAAVQRASMLAWICRHCGEEGEDLFGSFAAIPNEYEALRRLKSTGGFKDAR
jgi:ribosomal protein L37AE/L43A